MSLSFAAGKMSALRKRLSDAESKALVSVGGGATVYRIFDTEMQPVGEHPTEISPLAKLLDIVLIPGGWFLPDDKAPAASPVEETSPVAIEYLTEAGHAALAEEAAERRIQWALEEAIKAAEPYVEPPVVIGRLAVPKAPLLIDAPVTELRFTRSIITDKVVEAPKPAEPAPIAPREGWQAPPPVEIDEEALARDLVRNRESPFFVAREAAKAERMAKRLAKQGIQPEPVERPENIAQPMVSPPPVARPETSLERD